MVQTKRPPVVKWNPYKTGENKAQIMKEVNQIVANKERRRKLGLETGALREFKGNTHWNLYISLQIAEILSKRINEDLKNIFIQTAQGINSSNTYLNNISQQIKKTEYNLSNVTTLSSNNMIKVIQTEVGNLKKVSTELTKAQKGLDSKMKTMESKLEETSKQLNETLTETLNKFKQELNERSEGIQSVITEDIQSLKKLTTDKFSEIQKQTLEQNKKTSDSITGLSEQVSKDLSEKVTELNKNLVNIKEQITNFQEVNNNVLDDQQNLIVNEFQEGVGGLIKQNIDNYDKIKEEITTDKNDIIKQVDESTENLSSIFEATNEHMDKINEDIIGGIKKTEDNYKKELNKEVTDLRTILSTIRSDIELMKSVLTKIDSKVH